jgi:hypothetical protein
MDYLRNLKLLLIIPLLLFTDIVKAGEPIAWLTYSQSKYIFSPGIEGCYLFRPHLGLNFGLSVYIQNPEEESLTNITHNASFGFYSANIGVSAYVFKFENHSAGLIAGFKLYYGPDYRKFRYYEEGGYYIYFDASSLEPDYGLDLGIFYIYSRITLLGKWDFARNRFRIGIGYRFNT